MIWDDTIEQIEQCGWSYQLLQLSKQPEFKKYTIEDVCNILRIQLCPYKLCNYECGYEHGKYWIVNDYEHYSNYYNNNSDEVYNVLDIDDDFNIIDDSDADYGYDYCNFESLDDDSEDLSILLGLKHLEY